VAFGENVTLPKEPDREGYKFTGWLPSVTEPISANINTYAQYEKIDSSATKYTVRFIDYDDTVLYTQLVNAGEDAIEPRSPSREGYVFTGWRPAVTAIDKDTDTYAQYGVDSDGDGKDDNGGSGSGTGSGNGNGDDGNGSGGNTAVYYTLTVQNGSGSGSYVAGASVIVIAGDPAKGQDFDRWTIDPDTTKLASKLVTATVVTMPESEVTVTAHYVSDGTSSANTSSSNTSGGNTNNNSRPSTSNNSSGTITNNNNGSGGTTVIISKNGLSNTGVVTAVVNGSTDDFVIKLSENNTATEDVLRALLNEFGSLDNIIYFPMDISLYDSTGNTKITDTTGLSIDITLPLPDSMITYAGNNKVASVVNQRLEKLNAKFSTISGVACVTFTATHFSPYVIYVDTSNLTAGTISDDTPKTGDGVHPKWFLAIGLACMSMVFFMKKDRAPRRRLA
jgi:hypothetical protein